MGWYESRNGYSTVNDVSIMYGINDTTIIDWITKGYLKAEVREHEKPKYWISDEQLQNFDREYNEALRLIKRGDRKNNATVVGPKMVEIFNRTTKQTTIPIETVNEFKKDICTEDSTDDFVPDETTYDGFEEEKPMDRCIKDRAVYIVMTSNLFNPVTGKHETDIIGVSDNIDDAKELAVRALVSSATYSEKAWGADECVGWETELPFTKIEIVKRVIE